MALLTSWIPAPTGSDFPLENLPFGVFSTAGNATHRVGTAVGDSVIDLAALAAAGLLPPAQEAALRAPTLNAFMAAGRPAVRAVRSRLQALLSQGGDPALHDNAALRAAAILPTSAVTMHLPATIGDYTDFYSSRDHAHNVGVMMRGAANALQPNWLHLPVGYHGRASTVVVSGTPFKRPCGQLQASSDDPTKGAVYGPSSQLDFELEVAAFVGVGNAMGDPIRVEDADAHIFGYVLMNDWSGELQYCARRFLRYRDVLRLVSSSRSDSVSS